jgi:hypothetical protein
MSTLNTKKRKAWCIVVADDHGPEFVPLTTGDVKMSPVQYCGFGDPATFLQKTMHRALRIAHPSQIAVTVREDNRTRWEPALWFIRPEQRFVSDTRMTSSLATAAALLPIAADSASNVVTILPTRCYVGDERILSSALDQLYAMLPGVPEGVATLGMVDIEDGVDEGYLMPCAANEGPGLAILGMARWPALAKTLADFKGPAAGGENRLRADMCRGIPRSVLPSLRWSPPLFPQRALRVFRCGWRGLHTARAVYRISAACVVTIDSVPQFLPKMGYQLGQTSPFRM